MNKSLYEKLKRDIDIYENLAKAYRDGTYKSYERGHNGYDTDVSADRLRIYDDLIATLKETLADMEARG